MPNKTQATDSVSQLHHIAAKLVQYFKKIKINTIADLLWYFPFRYDDLSQVKKIKDLTEGELATVRVKITNLKTYRSFKQKMIITKMLASDDSDTLEAMWFRQKFISQILKEGDEIYLSGKPQKKHLLWQFNNPTYEKMKDEPLHSARLVPIYHLSGRLTQKQLRFLMNRALKLSQTMNEPLPVDILNQEKYPWFHQALQEIHFPTNEKTLDQAVQRLKFQELFYLQCKYQLSKNDYQKQPTYSVPANKRLLEKTIEDLPFTLTNDQERTLQEILADLSPKKPMNRLIEGDVGSGKTIVAFLAALNIMSAGWQTAMIASTEILAQQHFQSSQFVLPKKYLANIALLTKNKYLLNNHQEISKKELLKKIKEGQIKFMIGTHTLIQDKINFKNLALVIIDEQHRFGVNQRQSLKNKSQDERVPHLLSMTATPIPRTLSLTLYGDLDISLIKEKPAGRQPVKTFLVPENKRNDAYKFIREKIELRQQVFIICPIIDESDKLGVKSVTQEYEKLNQNIFPDLEIRQLHGQLKTEEKEKIMADFKNNRFPILVATSIIEVGVDIPQATLMIIEGAERFGLSQLHQFRGRIGRNDLESFCLLFTTDQTQLNKQRLKALTQTNDGFKLAELDLKLRGAGELFGTKQTGLMPLKIARLTDTELIKKAQIWAKKVTTDQKYLSQKQLQNTLNNLKTKIHLE